MNGETFNLLRRAGQLKRLHTLRTVEAHTLARHVYGSLVVALDLLGRNEDCRMDHVMPALLVHDAAEVYTGDVPAPVKRASPMLDAALRKLEQQFMNDHGLNITLSEREGLLCKACDIIDLGWACVEEAYLGNRSDDLQAVLENVLSYLRECLAVYGVDTHISNLTWAWARANA